MEIFEKEGALYLLQYKNNMSEASLDSLNKYGYFPFQSRSFLHTTDAMEMLRSSSLMQNIQSKELVIQIIQVYSVIKGSHQTFQNYSEIKNNMQEKLSSRQEFRKFSNKEKPIKDYWNFIFKLPEGLAIIRQISFIHDAPQRMYGRHLKFIDETITAIDKEYN